jgi:hypothetical protein
MEVELLSSGMQNSADSQIAMESVAPKLQQTLCGARAGVLLRRSVPVSGILATHRPGAIMDKSERQFVGCFGPR